MLAICKCCCCNCLTILLHISEKNSLSFIETSALDSTNVEQAFQNILTGKTYLVNVIHLDHVNNM